MSSGCCASCGLSHSFFDHRSVSSEKTGADGEDLFLDTFCVSLDPVTLGYFVVSRSLRDPYALHTRSIRDPPFYGFDLDASPHTCKRGAKQYNTACATKGVLVKAGSQEPFRGGERTCARVAKTTSDGATLLPHRASAEIRAPIWRRMLG